MSDKQPPHPDLNVWQPKANASETLREIISELANAGFEIKKKRVPKGEDTAKTPDERLDNHLETLTGCLAMLGATYDPLAGAFTYDGKSYLPESMALRCYVAVNDKARFSRDAAKVAMEKYINDKYVEMYEAVVSRMRRYDPIIGDVEVRRFAAFMTDKDAENVDPLDVAAIQSMIWQIKRKFAGHTKVAWPLMVVFSGGQGFGKSWWLEELFRPVGPWRSSAKLTWLNNQFNNNVFNKYYVIAFEEMDDYKHFDIQALKNVITEPTIAYRAPHTSDLQTLANNATCYGTSNNPITHTLRDDTGARRWWEIQCPRRQFTEADRVKFATIDLERLWDSVDGSDANNPRALFREAFNARQSAYRVATPVEDFFLEEVEVTGGKDDRVPEGLLYDRLATWFKRQELKLPARKTVREWARNHGYQVVMPNNRAEYVGVRLLSPDFEGPRDVLNSRPKF